MGRVKVGAIKKVPTVAIPKSSEEEAPTFVDEEARVRFENEISKRGFHQEKGFFITSGTHYGLTYEVAKIIDLYNWRKFPAHPRDPCAPVVKEFYANITSP